MNLKRKTTGQEPFSFHNISPVAAPRSPTLHVLDYSLQRTRLRGEQRSKGTAYNVIIRQCTSNGM